MKSIAFKIFVAFLVIVVGTILLAQENPDKTEPMLLNYLTGYCEEGEKVTFVDFIKQNARTVEPLLVNYVRKGVPENLVEKLRASSAKQYEERKTTLGRDLDFGLSKEDLESVKQESQEDFTNKQVREFKNGFMSQAIFGLSLIETEEAKALVNEIAADEKNPYQRAAQNAVNQTYLKRKE